MANGYSALPGELNAPQKSRNRSQTTVCLPPAPSPPKKRASSFYPPRGPDETADESNPDPFYLEQSLKSAASWGSCRQDFRHARTGEEIQRFFMLALVKSGAELPVASPGARGETARSQANSHRSTLSVVELEHQLSLQQLPSQPWAGEPTDYSQGSFSSVHTEATPDLTPSSSFSSNSSAPIYPETVIKATEQLSLLSKQANETPFNPGYPSCATPLNRSQITLATLPSTPPICETRPQPTFPNDSSETLIMPPARSQDAVSLRGKPLPSLPSNPRSGNGHPPRKPPPSRLVIEPSMISSPSLIDPVTLEPHRSHFDQALFIPANECPSPVPSPGPPSPAFECQPTAPSSRERPSTSASEMYCEQSVWESDSENEDADPRSLSRKPIDTLKKVRSRVQLRVAKSTPKLQNHHNHPGLEKFPTMPEAPRQALCCATASPKQTVLQARPGRDILRSNAQHTLRLVAPSTTSLVHPRSRRNSSKTRTYDIDRSTAAAMQAKSRRRQRSDCPEISLSAEREKMCTFCREERSDKAIHHSLTLSRPPLYKRVWESLRVLGCHGDITPPRPRKAM
ncbi:hypothetical protein ARAM_002608 [Aspergillus rambellii]|uniref:Uncharacterized protein n=3 Tax=Aspergillus subgen. Nidulantes TaxID=2720870 RepID=A0A0F8UVY4_9EURO|nr:hypothetical protein ARAM_002608 [Aspergillus rambellii]KKK16196.1 hypothetical protein AOCH_006698 [Aspergillus ochraceoroseus]